MSSVMEGAWNACKKSKMPFISELCPPQGPSFVGFGYARQKRGVGFSRGSSKKHEKHEKWKILVDRRINLRTKQAFWWRTKSPTVRDLLNLHVLQSGIVYITLKSKLPRTTFFALVSQAFSDPRVYFYHMWLRSEEVFLQRRKNVCKRSCTVRGMRPPQGLACVRLRLGIFAKIIEKQQKA